MPWPIGYRQMGLCLIVLLMGACRAEFNPGGALTPTPAVMAILDASDTVHFIRIQRAFLDEETGAYQLAADPAQIYYDDLLEVQITDLNTGATHALSRVDGGEHGLEKDSGTFAGPNILYRFTAQLDPTHRYRLDISHRAEDWTATAETAMVGQVRPGIPSTGYLIDWHANEQEWAEMLWYSASHGAVYDLSVTLTYREVNAFGDASLKSVRWLVMQRRYATPGTRAYQLEFLYPVNSFFGYLAAHLPALKEGEYRILEDARFHLSAGGEHLASWLKAAQTGTSITSFLREGDYSNVHGGVGILSSRSMTEISGISFSAQTLDSLIWSPRTSHLRFRR